MRVGAILCGSESWLANAYDVSTILAVERIQPSLAIECVLTWTTINLFCSFTAKEGVVSITSTLSLIHI